MEPDAEVEAWAEASHTNVLFGLDNLVQRLAQLDDVRSVHRPPTAQRIQQEIAVFLNDAPPIAEQAANPQDCPTALHAQQVTIHHLVVNLFASPGQLPLDRDTMPIDATDSGAAMADNVGRA